MIEFSWLDALDILIVAALVFMVIRFFANTKSIPMLTGLLLILILAVVSNILSLPTMKIVMNYTGGARNPQDNWGLAVGGNR